MNAHIHAENMRLYAEDATKTDKPWELWEFISFGMEDWQTLNSSPTWGFATEYRHKVKEADPRDAERYHWMRETFVDDGVIWPRDVSLAKTGEELDAAIDAAIAAAKGDKS